MKSKIEKLEMLRGCAAMYVVAHHFLHQFPAFPLNGVIGFSLRFGQEAVIAFFLFSGFVIYYSTHEHRDQSFKGYFTRRATRIYPIFLTSLMLSYGLSRLTGKASPGWRELFGNLFMLQDYVAVKPGVLYGTFCGNAPLWSLSYEWWFYMMFFPVYKLVPSSYQLLSVASISLVGLFTYAWYPNQISLFLLYFILWWSGLELARTYSRGMRPTFSTQRFSLLILAGFCVLVSLVTLKLMPRLEPLQLSIHPLLEIRHFMDCFVLLGIGLLWSSLKWKGFTQIFGVFSLVAPISYAVYVFHFPIWIYLRNTSWISNPLLRPVVATILTLILAYLAEIPLQRVITRWVRARQVPARSA